MTMKRSALVLLMALLPACGPQLMQVDPDGGDSDAGLTDAGLTDSGIVDLTAPVVIGLTPLSGTTNVGLGTTVTATFSEPMRASTVDQASFTVTQGGLPVGGGVAVVGALATFTPTSPLSAGLLYQATLTTAVTDLAGNPLAVSSTWAFTTAMLVDSTPPAVIMNRPRNLAISVSLTTPLTATFSEPLNATTLDASTFTLARGLTLLPGTVTFESARVTATFVPLVALDANTTYTATLTTGIRDVVGNALAQDFTWSFTTNACGQAPIALGSAANFAVLAGSAVTTTGASLVTGDLGVSPGTAVVGLPPGNVSGTLHIGDPTAAQGIADLATAYAEAAGRSLCPVTVSGNIGGQTLTPGLYKSTSSLAVTSGDLTLDAQGDPDGMFIFQAASTLTTTAGRQVVLTGGAKATNVFWQVGSSATLGSTTSFQGTIMADQSITLNTGATLTGRALARIAAVSLDSNTIVKPSP